MERFRDSEEHKALVLSLRAGGQGLNLQQASYVFHFDRWWNPAVEHQAEDRSHRMGQEWPVHVYKYICENTIEERIDEVIRQKQLLFDDVVDDVSMDLGRRLTADELYGLFGLKPPRVAGARPARTGSSPEYSAMSGVEFEEYVERLLKRRGWQVTTTPITRDGGIDLRAEKPGEVEGSLTLLIQCKNHAQPVGVDVVRELSGVLPPEQPATRGVVACPSGFSADARTFGHKRGILLWDRNELFKLASTETPAIQEEEDSKKD